MRRPRSSARGFTLIELIIAAGMAAMLALTLYIGLSVATRARASMTEQISGVRQAAIVLDLVEQNLRSVQPPTGTLSGPFIGTSGGTADLPACTIDCFSLGEDFGDAADLPGGNGTRHVLLYLTGDADKTFARDLGRNPLGDVASVESQVLAKNVAGFGVRYFDGADWVDAWDSTTQNTALPLAAELTVVISTPSKATPGKTYRATRVVRFSCGRTIDQAVADAAAAGDAAGNTESTPTPAGSTP